MRHNRQILTQIAGQLGKLEAQKIKKLLRLLLKVVEDAVTPFQYSSLGLSDAPVASECVEHRIDGEIRNMCNNVTTQTRMSRAAIGGK